jgi:hypothetical protein
MEQQGYSGLFQQRQKMHNDFAVMDFHARFMLFFTLKICIDMQNQAGGSAAKVGARCTQLVYRTAIVLVYKRNNFCAISLPHAPLETRAHTRIDVYTCR